MRWTRGAALGTVLTVLGRLASGCTIDDLEIAGKACPCVGGFVCDEPRNVCVPGGAALVGGDAGSGDLGPPGVFVVQRFAPRWSTSRSVRWDWEVAGSPDDFAEYQIVVGDSEDAVRRRDSTTTLFDRGLNPELGSFGGRDFVPPGGVAHGFSVTDRHKTSATTFAMLIVRDKAGGVNTSDIVSTTTMDEEAFLVLFADEIIDGANPTPTSLKRVTKDCYAGSAGCLHLAQMDCGDASSCVVQVGLDDFDFGAISGMSADEFPRAFIEFAARGGSLASSRPYIDLIVTVGAPACRIDGLPCRFRAHRSWSFRPGATEFRLVQLPLETLRLETLEGPGRSLRYEDLQANNFRIGGLTLESEWTAGAAIGLDHAHVRW